MGSAFRRPFNNLNNSNNDFLKDRRPGLLGNSLNTYNQPGTSNYYGLTSFELDKLKRFFAAVGGRDRAISFQEFFYFFAMMNPDIKGLKLFDLAEKSFMYSDTDKDGYLNFDEFVRFYLSRFPGGLPGGFPDLDYSHFENHFQRQRCGDCEPSRTYKCSDDFIDCAPRRKSCLPAVEYAPRSVYKTREVEYIDDLPSNLTFIYYK